MWLINSVEPKLSFFYSLSLWLVWAPNCKINSPTSLLYWNWLKDSLLICDWVNIFNCKIWELKRDMQWGRAVQINFMCQKHKKMATRYNTENVAVAKHFFPFQFKIIVTSKAFSRDGMYHCRILSYKMLSFKRTHVMNKWLSILGKVVKIKYHYLSQSKK